MRCVYVKESERMNVQYKLRERIEGVQSRSNVLIIAAAAAVVASSSFCFFLFSTSCRAAAPFPLHCRLLGIMTYATIMRGASALFLYDDALCVNFDVFGFYSVKLLHSCVRRFFLCDT